MDTLDGGKRWREMLGKGASTRPEGAWEAVEACDLMDSEKVQRQRGGRALRPSGQWSRS